jgi:hypothetical protein
MFILIILLLIIVIGVWMIKTSEEWESYLKEGVGVLLTIIGTVFLILHIIGWCSTSYSYNLFVEKRTAFVETLQNAREAGNEYETAAIVKEVAAWNGKLAEMQYKNKTFFFDCYVDDRIQKLKPIK